MATKKQGDTVRIIGGNYRPPLSLRADFEAAQNG
jgi:hypothetical protein